MNYTLSRYSAIRRKTREVMVGDIGIGGDNRIRIQSMTTTDTCDVDATVAQAIRLAEAGCEIIRVTAPTVKAATALKEIREKLNAAKVYHPLVADIHFMPAAAMEAIEHVEKVRINPGNYADRKINKVHEYDNEQYKEELERLHEAFSPLVLRAKELGRSLRIGTNHGSLSDRILSSYGDTPLGMVESALEFVRICRSHDFHDIILSLKASNPKVMIQAYRLAVAKMKEESMDYPLHLGVTEAGDGEDGRIKSAIGIGSLLYDGIGDTIRVSLTEEPEAEIPVAKDITEIISRLWSFAQYGKRDAKSDDIDPFCFNRRNVIPMDLGNACLVAKEQVPRVVLPLKGKLSELDGSMALLDDLSQKYRDNPVEAVMLSVISKEEMNGLSAACEKLFTKTNAAFLCMGSSVNPDDMPERDDLFATRIILVPEHTSKAGVAGWLDFIQDKRYRIALSYEQIKALDDTVIWKFEKQLIAYGSEETFFAASEKHPVGNYRELNAFLKELGSEAPIWIRANRENSILKSRDGSINLLEDSILLGSVLCDGIGEIVSVENEEDPASALTLSYNILQGAGARASKTEFISCPSCGRTLFDIQQATKTIREKTGHLKGVKIAIMGCIVNGLGEMADADFGYVGGAPKKINLYVGKKIAKVGVPEENALEELVAIIKTHGRWYDREE